MMQSADLRYGDDSPDLALLYRQVFRAILMVVFNDRNALVA